MWHPPTLVSWGLLRKPIELPYEIVEAGRQWFCVVEQWLKKSMELHRVSIVNQLFYKCGAGNSITLSVAKKSTILLPHALTIWFRRFNITWKVFFFFLPAKLSKKCFLSVTQEENTDRLYSLHGNV